METSDHMVISGDVGRIAGSRSRGVVREFAMSVGFGVLIALFLPVAESVAGDADSPPTSTTTTTTPTPTPDDSAAPTSPQVDLGRLLKLPDSYAKPVESRRGMGQAEWEARFERVRLDLAEARTALETAQAELGNAAGDSSQWSVAAPGTSPNPENTPLSYKLRQEIRRHRETIERAEKTLRALEIEADLAEVPTAWRATHIGTDAKELAVGDAKTTIR